MSWRTGSPDRSSGPGGQDAAHRARRRIRDTVRPGPGEREKLGRALRARAGTPVQTPGRRVTGSGRRRPQADHLRTNRRTSDARLRETPAHERHARPAAAPDTPDQQHRQKRQRAAWARRPPVGEDGHSTAPEVPTIKHQRGVSPTGGQVQLAASWPWCTSCNQGGAAACGPGRRSHQLGRAWPNSARRGRGPARRLSAARRPAGRPDRDGATSARRPGPRAVGQPADQRRRELPSRRSRAARPVPSGAGRHADLHLQRPRDWRQIARSTAPLHPDRFPDRRTQPGHRGGRRSTAPSGLAILDDSTWTTTATSTQPARAAPARGRDDDARHAYRRALALAQTDAERRALTGQLS